MTERDADAVRGELMWKLVSAVSAMVGAMVAKRLLRLTYRALRREEPRAAFDPTSERFTLTNALFWAVAAGVGLATARIVSGRLAALGWKIATGRQPPTHPASAVD
jgi:hypothetical protein